MSGLFECKLPVNKCILHRWPSHRWWNQEVSCIPLDLYYLDCMYIGLARSSLQLLIINLNLLVFIYYNKFENLARRPYPHSVLMLGTLQPNNHQQQNQQQQQPQQQHQQPQQGPIPPPPPQNGQDFTLSSVLHYLQTEWRRYERDRNEWEIERAEMRVRLSLVFTPTKIHCHLAGTYRPIRGRAPVF